MRHLLVEPFYVVGGEVGANAVEPEGVPVVVVLFGGVGRDLGDDDWADLDHGDLLGVASPVAGADLVGPRVPRTRRFQHCCELGGLGGVQWDGPADDLEDAAAVAATDDDFWAVDAASDGADDHFDRVAVLDF